MYTSFETIPIKIFFKIHNTGNIELLGKGKNRVEVWKKIVEEFHSYNTNIEHLKNIGILKKISLNKSKYTTTVYALDYLEVKRDAEIEAILKKLRYKLTEENFNEDLKRIRSQNESLKIIIAGLESEIKKPDKKKNKEIKPSHLEDLITYYCHKTGLSYDSNKITGSQFIALQKLALKIKT